MSWKGELRAAADEIQLIQRTLDDFGSGAVFNFNFKPAIACLLIVFFYPVLSRSRSDQPAETCTLAADLCHCQGECFGRDFLRIPGRAVERVLSGTECQQPASIDGC